MNRPTILLFAASLGIAACSGPSNTPQRSERGGASVELIPEHVADLVALSFPAVGPVLPRGWGIGQVSVVAPGGSADQYPNYRINMATPKGRCLNLQAESEGLGGVFAQEPPRIREILLEKIAIGGPVYLGWSQVGGNAEGWDAGRISTEWFGLDGFSFRVTTDDIRPGCRPAGVEDVVTVLRSLRNLDPAYDATLPGAYRFSELELEDTPSGSPRGLAERVAASFEASEGRGTKEVRVLVERQRHAVALVTLLNQADDSVRDQRFRVSMLRFDDGWHMGLVGSQVRCQPGRGSQEWTVEACR